MCVFDYKILMIILLIQTIIYYDNLTDSLYFLCAKTTALKLSVYDFLCVCVFMA